ncbi:ABC transporter permease subunit [Peteryoungia desertarenae]|uniref:ABC transporter permease subunit n=1 Tax=Peteryoungia desertarenae TaxID=1813451 RepID=A0ABX6QK43_9HYPH|nr:ABC transporter permease subunit [Peteryoungia desertarenae]QLF68933.1 ABC transporter permease subunit [Peteryoungia desertarenae]
MTAQRQILGRAAILVVAVFLLVPILVGFYETALPAIGLLPAIGADHLSFEPIRKLLAIPGIETSVRLSLVTGFAATFLSLLLAISFCAALHGRIGLGRAGRWLSPLLAAPHAAMALGIAFLIAPSGWFSRLVAEYLTGATIPPQLMTVNDPMGLALIGGLLVKEVPFFLLVIAAALNQIAVAQQLAIGRSLGYGRGVVWIKVIFPQVYAQIRLPVYAVLAFSLSVVDVAMILGPSNPPVLSVVATRLFQAANIDMLLPASAAAMLQTLLVVLGIGIWWIGERLLAAVARAVLRRGGRGVGSEPLIRLGAGLSLLLLGSGFLALFSLLVWSFTFRWPFTEALPSVWTGANWSLTSSGWLTPFLNTVTLGVSATLLSLALAILWLEGEDRSGRRVGGITSSLLYLPLLVPQIGFLYGLQLVFLRLDLDGTWHAVLWGHVLFVFPYVMLALSDPWRAMDRRYLRAAAALGSSPTRVLLVVKLPILLRPLMVAAAIGFSVSVAQYLPTLFIGAGRVTTLTTEAVALSSSGDRRVVGVYATLQAMLPMLIYSLAFILPRIVYADRRALKGDPA